MKGYIPARLAYLQQKYLFCGSLILYSSSTRCVSSTSCVSHSRPSRCCLPRTKTLY
jgi:hypothetical protein